VVVVHRPGALGPAARALVEGLGAGGGVRPGAPG